MASKSHFFRGGFPFIATFRTTSDNESIILPYASANNQNTGTIDWGDGTITPNTFDNRQHVYLIAGDYDVTINGNISSFAFSNLNLYTKEKIINIKQWGTSRWLVINFYGCNNLDVTATDLPDLSNLTNLISFFRKCNSLVFNNSVGSWDISNITVALLFFRECSVFNQNVNNWDISGVGDLTGVFFNCFNFNQPLNNWNVSNVTNFQSLFYNATSFNQDISGWLTTGVTNFNSMFFNATSFNQDISSWDFSSVNNTNSFFDFMRGKSQANYDATYYDNLLIKWASDESVGGLPIGVVGEIDMGAIKYTSAGASARQLILDNNKATTITDGGQI